MASQFGSAGAVAGLTRREGCISQSISMDTTARVPVRQMKLMKMASFSPTHWWMCHQIRLAFRRVA